MAERLVHGLLCVMMTATTAMCMESQECPGGTFLPIDEVTCRPCSLCPENQVVRETCSGRRDTLCGPFKEFQMFQAYQSYQVKQNQEKQVSHPNDVFFPPQPMDCLSGICENFCFILHQNYEWLIYWCRLTTTTSI